MLLLVALLASPLTAQTPEQLQLLRENPSLVRQRIQQSGLTPEQIRQRLQAAGYDPTLLDPFLQAEPGMAAQAAVNAEMLRALGSLGVAPFPAQGLEQLGVETGAERPVVERDPAGLQLFGLDVFRGRTTQFQPMLTGPVPSNYRVGPGDVLVLVLTGDVEFVHQLDVTREGFIVIPQVGQIYVNNLTMDQLNTTLRQRLGQSYSGIRTGTTRFDVTIARLRTNQVYVIGEVVQPGSYQLASVATVLNALYASGGPTARGNFRRVQVLRQSDTAATLDLYEYLMRGGTRGDIILEQGDVVFVPMRGARVSVTGAVERPAIYELRGRETLSEAIELAGGFRPGAELRRLAVHRILPAGERGPGRFPRAAIDVALETSGRDGGRNDGTTERRNNVSIPALTLEDGDSIVVDGIGTLDDALYVRITGMVSKPGRYPWQPGITLRDLVYLARGPAVGADLREAEVARLPNDRSRGELAVTQRVPLDSTYLFHRDSAGRFIGPAGLPFPASGTSPDVALQPYDLVTILRQPEFELQRTVAVTGEVEFPGTYALRRKDERVRDLITRAGDLLPTAYAPGARFYRQGRLVNVDLQAVLADGQHRDNLMLQPNDSLIVPEYSPVVRVEGAVVTETDVLYQAGAGVNYYIENAGGFARNADEGRITVRYANGAARVKRGVLFFASAPKPEPGSVVTVATKPEPEPFDVTRLLGTVAQILASTVAIVAIATR
jgi:polysaccharide export outer membrane protein